VAFIAVNFFDLVVSNFLTGEKVNFSHSDEAFWNFVFPFFDFALIDDLICQTVTDKESSFA
jgi:hypothetical protein